MNASLIKGPDKKPPRPMSPVDQAGPEDLESLVWFLKQMRHEIGDGNADLGRLVAWANAMTHREGGIALIVKGGAEVEASLGIIWENPILHRDMHMRAVWNCVLPAHRNTGHAKSLLSRAKGLANAVRRPLFLEEVGADPDSGRAKLARRHLTQLGQLFVHLPA